MGRHKELAERLGRQLTEAGCLTQQAWRDALHTVPRACFAPVQGWYAPDGPGRSYPIDLSERTDEWWEAVYSDGSVITQIDDGATDPSTGKGDYSSALSAPGAVLTFLELLRVEDRNRVLDVGTGTGYTAALLSHRVGERNVTSIDIDPQVAKEAAANLDLAGWAPTLIVGDAATLRPEGGPFDRIHVTCGVRELPYGWVERTRIGGRIVFPWMPGIMGGHRTALTVLDDGTAIGRFHGGAGYMMLRSQRWAVPAGAQEVEVTIAATDPRSVAWAAYGADVAMAALLPDVRMYESYEDGGEFSLGLSCEGVSWASVDRDGDSYKVTQAGPRYLWEEVEAAFFQWAAWGSPSRDRFGMTVNPEGQHLWLDDPTHIIKEQ